MRTGIRRGDGAGDRDREIALARSAGPAEVARGAAVYVLGPRGYELAVRGVNGFSWAADHAEHGLPFLIFEGQPNAMVIVPVGGGTEE